MSEPKAQGQEPTMEEILASIRRIISENDEPDASSSTNPAQPPTPQTGGSDGVLELTNMVGADGKVVSLAVASPPNSGPPSTQEHPPMADPDLEPPAKPQVPMADDDVVLSAAEPQSAAAPKQIDGVSDALVGVATAAASTAAFAALTKELHRGGSSSAPVQIGSGRTLEDLVQETIRPMLREWLDANLPAMVERMIKREIDRMARRAEEQ